jgi:2-oxoglutarate ferredoxin oxidoreductase subunit alpha
MPRNIGDIISRFKHILVPEVNHGQLKFILQGKFIRQMEGLSKSQGIPFKESEIENKVLQMLNQGGK